MTTLASYFIADARVDKDSMPDEMVRGMQKRGLAILQFARQQRASTAQVGGAISAIEGEAGVAVSL